MLSNNELLSVLRGNAYIIGNYLRSLPTVEQEVPLKAYNETLKAINELNPTPTQIEDRKLLLNDSLENNNNDINNTNEENASSLLLASGLLVDKQVRHPNNQHFIGECNAFINEYGVDQFNRIIARTIKAKSKTKIKNIYSYFHMAMENEKKSKGLKNA